MDEHLVTELIELERRIAADEYTLVLARAADGTDANKAALEEDLKRRIAATMTHMDSLRIRMTETTAELAIRPKRTRNTKRSDPAVTTEPSRRQDSAPSASRERPDERDHEHDEQTDHDERLGRDQNGNEDDHREGDDNGGKRS